MQLCAIGLHRNNVIEKQWQHAPIDSAAFKQYCRKLSALNIKKEALFISSVHSIEIFAVIEGDILTKKTLTDFLFESLSLKSNQTLVSPHYLEGPDAVRHFLYLALGVEPIVQSSENDFFENTSKSIAIANETGNAGLVLNRLYQTAIMLAAKIEQNGLSYDYSLLSRKIESLIKKIFGSLDVVRLMVVGSNKMTEFLISAISAHQLKELLYVDQSAYTDMNSISSAHSDLKGPLDINDKISHVQVVLRMNQDFSESFNSNNLHKIISHRKNLPLLIVNLDTTILPNASLNKLYNLFVYELADFQQRESTTENGMGFTRDFIEKELKQFFTWFYSKEHYKFGNIIGRSKLIEHVLELIARISQTRITVLIQGESGTGKELVARAVHGNSPRCNKPFISVNCGALPDTLLESELFGYERGAFTGATSSKKGLLEEADGGTLLLDEIGDTSPAFQVKLLRVLQEGEMRHIGSTESMKIDVRIIAATNKRLDELVAKGVFRKDLFYRINVVQIDLPSLQMRKDDIQILAEHFIAKYSAKMKKRVTGLDKQSAEYLLGYSWPGNVRELENIIERAVALSLGHKIIPEDLPSHICTTESRQLPADDGQIVTLRVLEKQHIIKTLAHYSWDYDIVAQALGIGRTTLWRKMKEYGVEKPAKT